MEDNGVHPTGIWIRRRPCALKGPDALRFFPATSLNVESLSVTISSVSTRTAVHVRQTLSNSFGRPDIRHPSTAAAA